MTATGRVAAIPHSPIGCGAAPCENHAIMQKPQPQLRVLDLFSGIGGFSLGLEKTGRFTTVAFCEIDPFCQRLLRARWPGIPVYEDVRTLDFKTIAADIVTGGFPCQDISNSGHQQGIEGARSGLWSEIVRAIRDIRPQFAIVENVSALTFRGLGRVLGDLAEIGYGAQWHCIPASASGAVHHRDRIWIIAYPNEIGWVKAAQILAGISAAHCRERSPDIATSILDPISRLRLGADLRDIRKDDGIPAAMDRLGSVGNAICPEIATIIGEAIASVLEC